MRLSRIRGVFIHIGVLCAVTALSALCVSPGFAQDPPAPEKDKAATESQLKNAAVTRVTIEITGEKNVPIENASVYVKYVEEHAIKKNKKLELNVKTGREGVAHVPNAPMGRALVQVVADG